MTKPISQILSNETVNSKGFSVINNSIDWNRYKKNPILLRNRSTGEHYGEPIGYVDPSSILLNNGNWTGTLVFDKNEIGREAQRQYNEGVLNGVSIFGMARIAEQNGKRYTTRFDVWEISLVNIPSNPDAVAIREGKQALSAVSFNATEIEQVTSLSASDIEIINQIDNKQMEGKETNEKIEGLAAEIAEDKISISKQALDAVGDFLRKIGFTKKEVGLSVEEDSATQALAADDKGSDDSDKGDKGDKDDKKEGLSVDSVVEDAKEKEETKATETPTGLAVGKDASVFNVNENITKKQKTMTVPFSKWVEDAANASKVERIVSLSASSGKGDGLVQVSLSAAEDVETQGAIQELAASMKADANFMATIENVTFQVNDGRRVRAVDTIESLSSGHGSAQFIQNADLAKISWLSLFVKQLFPSDKWAGRVRRVSVRDREGIIWVESAMNPEIYFGDRAPVNAKNYLYDDLPRGLARKVFALQPILWQTSNSDILGYNDRATGQAEAMRIMATAVHNYWLQVIAESVPASNHVPMTGTAFPATGRFPINPAAAGNLLGLTLNDLIGVQGRFLARNLGFTTGNGVAVLAEPYYTNLAQNDEVKSILTRQLSDTRPDGFNYGGFDVMVRSIIAGFNTATNTVVDAEMYFDKPVDWATGAIDDAHVRPVLASTVYDIGLAFIPEEIIVGIGETNIHMVSDPNSYGWKMSMDIATGAGTLRSSAAGIALLRPTV